MFAIEKKPKSIIAESYRTLRTNIQYSSFDNAFKVIVITSPEPDEGKSTTAINLALSIAQEDKKVILIDCDLRNPSLYKKFGISNLTGLSDVIIGKVEISEVMYKYNDNLTLLPSGKIPPNPSEMLSSKSMNSLIESLKMSFDYIIIDTPPVQVVTDSQILSAKADGTILVVRSRKSKKESIKNTINLLKKVNANIIGTVLNGVEISKKKYHKYYDYK